MNTQTQNRSNRGMIRGLLFIALTLVLFAGFTGCTKNRKSEGLMDDPMTHFIQGKKYWDQNKLDQAEEEFKLAKSLDKKFGPALAGLAMVEASRGNFDKAEDFADDAIDLAKKKDPYGHMAMGIVEEKKGLADPKRDEDWYEDAEDEYKEAMEIAPDLGEMPYRLGHLYKVAYEFRKAEDAFKKVLELKNGYEKEADEEWQVVQKILRAAPGTRVGKKIALVEEITRADVAALFVSELEIDRIMEKRKAKQYDTDFQAPEDPREMQVDTLKKMKDITDIEDHWAKNFILDLQKYQIRGMEPSADHKFYPNEPITRGQYAMFMEDILIAITGDRALASKHLGTESRFPDVNASAPYYNAISNAVDKNIMDANLAGEFKPLETVDGPDALLIIRRIKELRR